ncbi:hypothetical protein [Enterobacter asburiae]|uniref:hypothetical protein n=1 Tax=Enterobacter asburiae TaxID=61645 RepID=UPI001C673FFD|nr:hypothetical protein [Enterobacter asburiae]
MNNKELVKAGHALAKAISNDTPLIEIAKIVSNLATQLDVQLARSNALAAENEGLKSKGRELLGEACAVYAKLNKLIDPAIGDFIDGQTLHEFQFALDCETEASDAFLAEVRAQGVEMLAEDYRVKLSALPTTPENMFDISHVNLRHMIFVADEFAAKLRQGGAA